MIAKDDPPATISKIGFDYTIPWGDQWVQSDFQRSAPFELGTPPAAVSPMTEDEIAKEMESLIHGAPQSWKDLLQHFRGQNYRDVYRAFGRLRAKLGRVVQPPYFPTRSAGRGTSSAKRHLCRQLASIGCITPLEIREQTRPGDDLRGTGTSWNATLWNSMEIR